MKHRVLAGVAIIGALSLGVAACGSSGSSGSGSGSSVKMGKTLVVESTPLSPMTDTFNPFSLTSTGYLTNAVSLYNEPLFIFNTLNSSQAPIPMLATGYSWSNGGRTLTLTIRSGVKWNDGKPFSASDVAYTFNLLKSNPKLHRGRTHREQRLGAQRDQGGAQLRQAAVREPVPDRAGVHRPAARLVQGQ
jgi:peptide/nickel transport system substrate-binding protein